MASNGRQTVHKYVSSLNFSGVACTKPLQPIRTSDTEAPGSYNEPMKPDNNPNKIKFATRRLPLNLLIFLGYNRVQTRKSGNFSQFYVYFKCFWLEGNKSSRG